MDGNHNGYQHQHHYYHHQTLQNPYPPPHAYSLRSDLSSNSTKITDYVTNHEIKFTKTEGEFKTQYFITIS